MAPDIKLSVEHVTKTFWQRGQDRTQKAEHAPAVEDVTFDVKANEIVSVVGPSGCGKTTVLRIIDGLLKQDSGIVKVNDRAVSRPGHDRAIVFQHANLLPWRSALRNVELGLELQGVPKTERRHRAEDALQLVGLAKYHRYYPHQLSGGMQQRVGLARALVINPEILLMDEPFGALDAQTREELQTELLRLHTQTRKTILFVTHDLDEAVYLGDRVVVMAASRGRVKRIVQIDIPRPRGDLTLVRTRSEFADARLAIAELIRR